MTSNEHPNSGTTPDEGSAPANPGAAAKSALPDPDITDPANEEKIDDEIDVPVEQADFSGEHHISSDHAEPTAITGTSNDNYIEGKYIDVGGGD